MMGRLALHLFAGTLLTLLLQMGVGLLGPAGIFLNLFTPLPAAMVILRMGGLAGAGIVAITTIVLAGIGQPIGAAGYFLQFGIGSLILAVLLKQGRRWDFAVGWALAASMFTAAIGGLGYSLARGVDLWEMVRTYVQAELDRAMVLYQDAGLPAEQLEEVQRMSRTMADFLVQAWPALAVVVTGIVLLLTVLFLGAFSGGKYQIPGPPFSQWKAPEHFIWVLILGGVLVLVPGGVPKLVGWNLVVVILPVYFLQGLAIVTWFFRTRNISPFFRNLGYLLVVILNPLPLIVTGMGIFDLWIDFRKSRIRKK